jgi:hypothetical protein
VSRENWCESPDPKLRLYLRTIDTFARVMKGRVRASTPRTWAQFWRVWSDEQVIQRQLLMRLVPPATAFPQRSGDWNPPAA